MKQMATLQANERRISVSTSIEEQYLNRIERLAEKDMCSNATIIRKCVIRHLPAMEREILGEEFVGGIPEKPKRKT